MKKLKEYIKILFYPVLLAILEFSLILIFTIIFNLNNNLDVTTPLYQEKLNIFISDYKILIVLISFLILLPILLKKINYKPQKIMNNKIVFYSLIGIAVGLSYNLFLSGVNKLFYFTDLYNTSNTNILVTLITTGILGPILEELIFRGIVYNKLKNIHKPFVATIITGLIFGLFHGNIIQFIYVFFLNFLFVKGLEKENNILVPIIIHISTNVVTTLCLKSIININLIFNLLFFIIFTIILIILLKLLYNNKDLG